MLLDGSDVPARHRKRVRTHTRSHEEQHQGDNDGQHGHQARLRIHIEGLESVRPPQRGEPDDASEGRPQIEEEEELVVPPSYAIPNPWAVVVEAKDADAAVAAMVRSFGARPAAELARTRFSWRPSSLPRRHLSLPVVARKVVITDGLQPTLPFGAIWRAGICTSGTNVTHEGQQDQGIQEKGPSQSRAADYVVDAPLPNE